MYIYVYIKWITGNQHSIVINQLYFNLYVYIKNLNYYRNYFAYAFYYSNLDSFTDAILFIAWLKFHFLL